MNSTNSSYVSAGTAALAVLGKLDLRRYAINRAEWREGVWGLAAAIFDSRGMVVAGIGISGPADRFLSSVLPSWSEAVMTAASDTSAALRATKM